MPIARVISFLLPPGRRNNGLDADDDANDHHAPGQLAVLSRPTRLLSTEFVAKPFEDAR
jgi:hypothetical protein